MKTKCDRWTWTLNNPTEAEALHLKGLKEGQSYICYGLEIAPETGTPHLQGYVEYKNRVTMTRLKKDISPRIHVELSQGTGQQNREYCSKDGVFEEYGEMKPEVGQGHRSDLDEVVSAVARGDSMTSLWRQFPKTMIRYHRGVEQLFLKTSPLVRPTLPLFPMETFRWEASMVKVNAVTILWGQPGVGKTSFAIAVLTSLFGAEHVLCVSHVDDLLGVTEETKGILFDDMDFKHLPRTSQIHLVDSDLPRSIHCRYRTASIPAKVTKVFTTNTPMGMIFDLTDMAIKRRVEIKELI